MTARTLIDVRGLAELVDRGHVAVFDCRFDLADARAGAAAYREGHIPGAWHADLEQRLSGRADAWSGRHPLPDRNALAAWLRSRGVATDTQVVCYDAGPGAFAARLWWLVRWLGHDAVAVLDGGWAHWLADGRPVEAGAGPRAPARAQSGMTGGRQHTDAAGATVQADRLHPDHTEFQLVDARAPERFRGEQEPIDPVAGHVPGALNRPFTDNLGQEGLWLSRETLRVQWTDLLGAVEPSRVVHMCGSGVTACHNLLAMEHAGLAGSRLYPGSWSEWIRDPSRPVTTGPESARTQPGND